MRTSYPSPGSLDRPAGRYAPPSFAKAGSDPPLDVAAAVRLLEESADYRILRRLQPQTVDGSVRPPDAATRIGIVVDTETTGLDHRRDEIVEIAMIAFRYDDDGIRDVVGIFEGLQEPSRPLRDEIAKLTGITQDLLAGQRIDPRSIEAFVAPANLVVAHNARFDRPFCQTCWPIFRSKAWACSMSEIPWRDFGIEGTKLSNILASLGFFHSAHRAADDCHALMEILRAAPKPDKGSVFASLLASSGRTTVEIGAEGAPFDKKDVLKARGYKWTEGSGGRTKAWRLVVLEEEAPSEIRFLEERIYRSGGPVVRRLEADRRHSDV